MARQKKNGQYLNVKIDMNVYQRLEEFCEETGYTKTAAVERALTTLMEFCEETGYTKTAAVERALTTLMNNHEADQETLRRIAEGSVKLVETGGDVHA